MIAEKDMAEYLQLNPLVEDCPTRKILDLISDKWLTLIITLLHLQPQRFSQLHRSIQGISQKMLTQNLRNLERSGLIIRTVYAEVPPRVEYRLTELGETLYVPVAAIQQWTVDHYGEVELAQTSYDRLNNK